jgi:hypothetical protein
VNAVIENSFCFEELKIETKMPSTLTELLPAHKHILVVFA